MAVLKGHYYVYPDMTVVCGEPRFDPSDKKRTTITNPTLVVEVLSESTEGYDRGDKFDRYREIESLHEVLLVSCKGASVQAFLRQDDGTWSMLPANGLEASIRLRSIDLTIPLAEIYERIDLSKREEEEGEREEGGERQYVG